MVFRPSGLGQVNLDFESYLESLLKLVSLIQAQKVQKGYFAAKDIPVFHLFQFPELARFKMFFWQKTIFKSPDLAGKKFPEENFVFTETFESLMRNVALQDNKEDSERTE